MEARLSEISRAFLARIDGLKVEPQRFTIGELRPAKKWGAWGKQPGAYYFASDNEVVYVGRATSGNIGDEKGDITDFGRLGKQGRTGSGVFGSFRKLKRGNREG